MGQMEGKSQSREMEREELVVMKKVQKILFLSLLMLFLMWLCYGALHNIGGPL